MKLQIRPEVLGNTYVVKHPRLGALVLDTNKIKEEDYEFYEQNGFKDYFVDADLVEGIEELSLFEQKVADLQQNPNPNSTFQKRLKTKTKTKK